MESSGVAAVAGAGELTSGASGRIRSLLSIHALLRALLYLRAAFLWLLLLVPRRRGGHKSPQSPRQQQLRRHTSWYSLSSFSAAEEDARRRRKLAEPLPMRETEDGEEASRCETFLITGARKNSLFCRKWLPPSSIDLRGIILIMHGLNEHSGRYVHFAEQLMSERFGVFAMDWIGHGGSDGLHGYVPSLDYVIEDLEIFLSKIKLEYSGLPCFLFGHSTGGAVVLKASLYPHIQSMVEGVILTSPALRVKPTHPIVGAIAPIFSLVAPKFQFKGANRTGVPVSRDPAALLAKYSDPLVYTGPIRVRTGHEILRISSYLMQNLRLVTVPFLVMHGTADRVTDPLASQDLYNEAPSKIKGIRLYDGFLHDLLFEPERDEIGADIIDWMVKMLKRQAL